MSEMLDIGNVLKLRQEIDDKHRVTKHIRSMLSVVDILPVDYQISMSKINKAGWAISYNFETAKTKYTNTLRSYDLDPVDGLRLWLTDDTTSQDDFSNNFGENVIQTAVNKLSGLADVVKSISSLSKSTGTEGIPKNIYDKAAKMIENYASSAVNTATSMLPIESEISQKISTIADSAISTAAEMVFQGKRISLPKIWKSSTYNPSTTFTIKLVSPYGNPEAIKEFIIKPLLYIIILATPKSKDGLCYGLAQPVKVNGYGMVNMNLAYIEQVSLRRGGRATAYNIYKQPLQLDILVTCKPLSDGFASIGGNDNQDIATFKDASTEYTEKNIGPAMVTVGNLINSLRPAPSKIINQDTVD